MRVLRRLWVVVAVVGSLGCSGLFNAALKAGGLNAEFHAGKDVVHPAEFPAGAPAGGEPVMSMDATAPRENVDFQGIDVDLTASHYRMQMAQYSLPTEALVPALATAGDQALAAGWTESPEHAESDTARVFRSDESWFTVLMQPSDDGSGGVAIFARLTPVHQPPE